MKKSIYLIVLLVIFFATDRWLFAQDAPPSSFAERLKAIYGLYKKSPADSCRQLEDALASSEAATLTPQESKKAYYFLANCNYSLKNLDKASLYYKKVAELDPQDPQPLLDAGSVSLKQGSYSLARSHYQEALACAQGDAVKEDKARALIEKIPDHWQQKYTASTGIGYDSNVNSGPTDTTHLLYGAVNYTLSSDDKPQDDFYAFNSVAAAFTKPLAPGRYFLFNMDADNTSYFSEKEFNTSSFSASTGYKKVFGGKSVSVSPFVNYQTLDDERYQVSGGVNLTGAARVAKTINIWPYLGWYTQKYFENENRNAQGVSAGTSGSYEVDEKTYLMGSFFYTYHKADENQFTYNSLFMGPSINRSFAENWKAAFGYNYQLYYYDAMSPAFGNERRDKGHKMYFNLDYLLKKFFKTDRATVTLNISYTDNNSNQSFQEYNKFLSLLKFTVSF